jgi:hypothetical protein
MIKTLSKPYRSSRLVAKEKMTRTEVSVRLHHTTTAK